MKFPRPTDINFKDNDANAAERLLDVVAERIRKNWDPETREARVPISYVPPENILNHVFRIAREHGWHGREKVPEENCGDTKLFLIFVPTI